MRLRVRLRDLVRVLHRRERARDDLRLRAPSLELLHAPEQVHEHDAERDGDGDEVDEVAHGGAAACSVGETRHYFRHRPNDDSNTIKS